MKCSFVSEQDQVLSTSKEAKEREPLAVETELDKACTWDLCTERLCKNWAITLVSGPEAFQAKPQFESSPFCSECLNHTFQPRSVQQMFPTAASGGAGVPERRGGLGDLPSLLHSQAHLCLQHWDVLNPPAVGDPCCTLALS